MAIEMLCSLSAQNQRNKSLKVFTTLKSCACLVRQMERYITISQLRQTNSVAHALSDVRDGKIEMYGQAENKSEIQDWH